MTFNEKQEILTKNLLEFSKKEFLASKQKELTTLEISRLCCESLASVDDIFKELIRALALYFALIDLNKSFLACHNNSLSK